jgi:hypothetical protein
MEMSIQMAIAACSAGGFAIFLLMAQYQFIFVPFFTPSHVEFRGLEDQYAANGSMSYTVSLKGFGSNCVAFEAELIRHEPLSHAEERVAYYSKIDDCRTIQVSQGPYNYSKDFNYSGPVVLGKAGEYKLRVAVTDEITKGSFSSEKAFRVA